MSAAEIMVLLIVGIVVVGPKRLPTMMRTAGRWISKMRRLSSDLRNQSGIDRIIREEGLEKELRELRSLKESLSKQALLDSLVKAADAANAPVRPKLPPRPITKEPAATKDLDAAKPEAAKDADVTAGPATPASAQASLPDTSTASSPPASAEAAAASIGAAASAAASAAAPLYKPAEGTVARSSSRAGVGVRRPLVLPSPPRAPYRSMREREFPSFGPDHYDALPDDLPDEEEELAAEAAAEAGPSSSLSAASAAAAATGSTA